MSESGTTDGGGTWYAVFVGADGKERHGPEGAVRALVSEYGPDGRRLRETVEEIEPEDAV